MVALINPHSGVKHAMAQEVKIEFRGEDEVVINDDVTIRSKPLVVYLKHVLDFYLGPQGGITITRDYYDEHIASYILESEGKEVNVYIGDTGVEVGGTEVKSELLTLLLRHALDAFFINSDKEVVIEKDTAKPVYYIRAKTPGG